MAKLLLTDALRRRKTLTARIQKLIPKTLFAGYVIGKNRKTNFADFNSEQHMLEAIKSGTQSLTDLQAELVNLVGAINKANVENFIKVDNKEYSLAQAIFMRDTLDLRKSVITHMRRNQQILKEEIEKGDKRIELKLESMLSPHRSSGAELTVEFLEHLTQTYRQQLKDELQVHPVDPLNINDLLASESEKLDDFIDTIETKLNVANATITIEF